MDLNALATDYDRDGYITGVPLFSENEANQHRKSLEDLEASQGAIHYKAKLHTVMTSTLAMSRPVLSN